MGQVAVSSRQVPRPRKKPKGQKPQRMNYYLPADLVRRLDRYVEKLAAENPLLPITRTYVIAKLLGDALDRIDAK